MAAKHVIVLMGLGLAAMVGYGVVSSKGQKNVVLTPRTATPSASADLRTDLGADRVITDSTGREGDPELYSNVWIGGTGWSMEVMATNRYQGELLVDMYQTKTTVVGNGYWVRAVVPGEVAELKRGDVATVRGRISVVDRVITGPVPEFRVTLDPAEVIDVQRTGR